MSRFTRIGAAAGAGLILVLALGGCPLGVSPMEYVAGGTGDTTVLRSTPLVEVLTPVADLSITGGTQVEVNWRAFASTRTAVLNVIVDEDQTPDNKNETEAFSNLALTQSTALVDTTRLKRGTYYVGVVMEQVGKIVAYDYAPGRVTIDQAPDLFFTSPRGTFAYDRAAAIVPRFSVAWELDDPDSTNTVEIFLDPDDTPNGNEVFLFRSQSQTGDSFAFDLPTIEFEPGLYRLLAIVSDGRNSFPFYAPGSVRLRARMAGAIDLRDLALGRGEVAGAVFEGFNPRDNVGSFVSPIGDIDRDGFGDFLVMAQFGKSRYEVNIQRTGIGEAYLIYGRNKRFSGRIHLNSTGTLFRGEVYTGVPEVADPIRPSRGITSFALLSDWDSDGVREMAFGIPFTDSVSLGGLTGINNFAPLDPNGYFRSGAVVVAAGSSLRPDLGFPGRNVFNLAEFGTVAHVPLTCNICGSVDPNDPDPDNPCPCDEGFEGPKAPFPLAGCPDTRFHQHIVDVNGVLNRGAVRLGCRFASSESGDQFGESVAAWDFDGIVMAAPNRDPLSSVLRLNYSVPGAGVISTFFCDVKSGFYPWTNTNGPPANDAFNYPGSQQSSGDRLIPHGGPYHYLMDDLLYSPGFVVDPDDTEPCARVIDERIATPENSVRFWSNVPGARLSNVKGLGDVNGDGLLDLVIGAPLAEGGAGACYVVLGRLRDLIRGGELQLEEIGLPMNAPDPPNRRIFDGIRIIGGAGERLGQSQDSAGDFNHDGYADVVIGSPQLNNSRGGAAVFLGTRDVGNLTETEIPFMELPQRGLGVVFVGENENDLAGARVAGVGDIDGDGHDDILIAAPGRSVRMDLDLDGKVDVDRRNCGVAYLVYGARDLASRRTPGGEPGILELRYIGTDGLPGAMFIGRNSGDYLGAGLGEQGDRSFGIGSAGDVDGDGAGDLLLGSVLAAPRDRVRAGEVYLLYGVRD